MKILKFIIIINLIIILIFVCTSCWNYREINDMSLIEGLAIDKIGDQYEITGKLLLAITEQQQEGTLQHFFVNATGLTVFDAIIDLISKEGKQVYFGQLNYIIISEYIAREDINQVLDIFMRNIESREDMWIFIASPPYRAEDVLHGMSSNELATYVEDVTVNAKSIAAFYPTKMYELVKSINEKGRDGLAPLMSKVTSAQGEVAHIEGSAVFYNNTMVGTLSGDESKTLIFITGKGATSILPVIYTDEQFTSKVSLDVTKNKTDIMPIFLDDGSIKICIHTYLNVVIGEIMNSKVDVMSPEGQEKLIAATSAFVKKNMTDLIATAQKEYKSDIFGFGEMIKNWNPTQWKDIAENWHDIFQSIEIDVNVTVKIYGSNLYKQIITNPLTLED